MTASERLRELNTGWRERNHGEYGWHEPCVLGGGEIQRDFETIGTLLPLIVDAVAAMEVAIEDVLLMDSPEGDSPRNIAGNLRAPLAALREHLEQP